ncbi:hypothetical protein [Timonella sp. A28]|uniref:hypothetical protein n=1 Tax=Timonella sp. A28 TaxID=3442640 RepID=UPI003EBA592E
MPPPPIDNASDRIDTPAAFTPHSVGGVWEYDRLCARGELVEILPGVAIPQEQPLHHQLRIRVAQCVVPETATLAVHGAAWLHCGGPVPSRLPVCFDRFANRPRNNPAIVPHPGRVWPSNVKAFGSLRVTTAKRTIIDLALLQEPTAAEWVRRFSTHKMALTAAQEFLLQVPHYSMEAAIRERALDIVSDVLCLS